jgi:hypothetical protein
MNTMVKKQQRTNKISLKSGPRVILTVLLIVFWVIPQAQAKNSKKGGGGLEQEITVTMPIPGIQFTSCEAYISLSSTKYAGKSCINH